MYDKNGNQIAIIEDGYLDIGLSDTIKDMFVNLLGAVAFSLIGYVYTINNKKYKFAKNFIPVKKENKKYKVKIKRKI